MFIDFLICYFKRCMQQMLSLGDFGMRVLHKFLPTQLVHLQMNCKVMKMPCAALTLWALGPQLQYIGKILILNDI